MGDRTVSIPAPVCPWVAKAPQSVQVAPVTMTVVASGGGWYPVELVGIMMLPDARHVTRQASLPTNIERKNSMEAISIPEGSVGQIITA